MDLLDTNIITGIEKICQVSRILLWDLAKEENLSPVQIQFLDYINNNNKELRTLTNLSLEFDLKKSTVSTSVNNLIKKGFLEKEQDIYDKRFYYLVLTKKAYSKIEKIDKWNQSILKKISAVTTHDKSIISKFFVNLVKDLYEDKIFKSAKMCYYCVNLTRNNDLSDAPYYCSYTNEFFSDDLVRFRCDNYKNL